jgi:hypothetical protein
MLEWSHVWTWKPAECAPDQVRPMSNLLTPPGLVSRHAYLTRHHDNVPQARIHPMPAQAKALIETEKGVRRLFPEETANGLGIPKEWKVKPAWLSNSMLRRTTSLFHWEYLSETLLRQAHAVKDQSCRSPSFEDMRNRTRPGGYTGTPAAQTPFSWKPPSLKL